jgi:hypothetical protein
MSCEPGDLEERVGLLPGKLFVAADRCGDSLQPVVHRALQHNRGVPRALWTKAPLALLRHRVGLLAVFCAAFLVAVGAAAGPLMNAGAESEALQSKLSQLTPLGAGLMIDRPLGRERGGISAVAAADQRRRAEAMALGRTLPSVGRSVLISSSLAELSGAAVRSGGSVLVVPMAGTNAKAHVEKLSGSGTGVWLSSAVVRRAGGRVTFRSLGPGAKAVALPVGAIYRSLESDLGNPYWVNFTARIRSRNPDVSSPPSFALMTPAQLYRVAGGAIGNDFEFPIDARSMTPGRAKHIAGVFRGVQRRLSTDSAFAAGLGCVDPSRPCRATSALIDAVRIAAAGNSSLRPVIDLLAAFCVAIALGAALIVGVFTGRRRAAEARLSLVGGEPRLFFLARAAVEALLPAVLGAAAGFVTAAELVRLFTPDGAVDAGVVRQTAVRVVVSVVASIAAVALGVTAARGRLGGGRTTWSSIARVPWEAVAIVAAAAAWIVLSSGGGLVKDRVAGSHPRLAVLLLPALVAAPLTGLVGRGLRSLVLRRVAVSSIPVFLALRRTAAAKGLVIALTVTVAAGVASLAFAEILKASLAKSSTEKALVSNGSDLQGLIDPARSLPASFPYPITKVAEIFDAGTLPSGRPIEVLAVDPPTLERVLAKHWPAGVLAAMHALGSSRAQLPAIAVGLGTGRQVVTFGGAQTAVQVVASMRAFPGMQPSQALLVFPFRALGRAPIQALTYLWATGPPRQVEDALARSSLVPSYLTAVAEFSNASGVQNITRTYGFLRIVAFGIVVLSLLALLLYLSGRERSQLVTSALLRRMGVSQATQAASVALESSFLVGVATVLGLVAARITAGAIVVHVDPLSQYSPKPGTVVPWLTMLASGAGVIVIAGVLAAILTLFARRSGVGEELRVN